MSGNASHNECFGRKSKVPLNVNTLSLINGTAQITGASATDQFLVSNLEKPIILTMIGSTAPVTAMADHTMDSQMICQNSLQSNISQMSTNALNSESLHYSRASSESAISFIDEDTNMSSHSLMVCTNSNQTTFQPDSQISQTFNLTNGLLFDQTSQNMDNNDNSIDAKVFKPEMPFVGAIDSNTCDANPPTVQSMTETVAQYLPLNSFNDILPNAMINNSNQMTDISTIPAISSMSCEPFTQPMPSTVMSTVSTEQSLSVVESMDSIPTDIENKSTANSNAFKSIISQNPVMSSTASTTPVTQANNISALSEMSDAELLCFINPATFDQI